MKTSKIYSILTALLMASAQMFGSTVELQRAKALGAKFVEVNFLKNTPLEWAYTAVTEGGRPAFYAFNGTSGGFVIVSACDLTSPILGYSETGAFHTENLPDALAFFLNGYAQSVDFAEERCSKADFVIAQEWENLERCGMTQTSKLGAVQPLIATHWDQECYYNEYCPEDEGGWCGHVKVGCVATAMGQIMKYWNHPEQGTGSHTNNSYFYGPLTVNFGETTYHWDEMPEQLTDYNDPVATLLYHCGVSVDMVYAPAPNGSGTTQEKMKSALASYFSYVSAHYIERANHPSYDDWTSIMRHALDSEIPIAYCGTDTEQGVGGHSFICDGYDANGLFHFNWGWSGELDGYFSIDNLQTYNLAWNAYQAMIYDIRPQSVYNDTPQAPSNLVVEPLEEDSYFCSISWKNPTKTLNNSNLSTIDQIIVKRDGQVVYSENNVVPGATMEITDEVPFFALYDYSVYAVYHGNHGESVTQNKVRFGPSCNWNIETNVTPTGGIGAAITLYNNAGQPVEHVSLTSSSQTFSIAVPLGRVSFGWSEGNSTVNNLNFTIKDADGQQVYHYSGSPSNLPEGLFLTLNNSCGNAGCGNPSELYAVSEGNDVLLSWLAANDETDYNVYRDGIVIKTVRNGSTSFVDEQVAQGGHCYFVTAFCEGGESEPTNEACATSGEGCEAASALWFEMTSNNKVKLTWESPQPNEGLSGYYLYRTKESEMNWKRIKTLNASATFVVDNTNLEDETSYLYKLVAYYQAIDCYSAPARSKYNEFEYFLRVYWSIDGVGEAESVCTEVFPMPGTDRLNVRTAHENASLQVFDILGRKMLEQPLTEELTTVNTEDWPSGAYIWKVIANGKEAECGKWVKK
jgi:hypothetical protein